MRKTKSYQYHFYLYLISVIAALSGLLFGYDTGVISGAILFIREDFGLTDSHVEIVISAVLLGACFGSSLGGKLTDGLGRKRILLLSSLLFIAGSLVSAWSSDQKNLIVSRLILGVAIGISSFAAPLYLAEISPPDVRGKIVSFNQLAITVGIVGSYLVNYLLADQGAWRWMLGLGVVPAVALLIGLVFLPESPRWMVMKNQESQAKATLRSIRNAHDVDHEIHEIRKSLAAEKPDWKLLFSPWVRPILVVAIGLAFFQQVTGINTLIYYAPTILQMAGFEKAQGALFATLGLGVVNVAATLVSLPLIDRVGRRPLLLGGLVGMGLSLILTGFSFYDGSGSWTHRLAVAGMFFYIISFAVSLGPICWLMISELFPLQIRGVGASAATAVNWIFNMAVSLTFLNLVNALGTSGAFWFYAGACFLGWIFVYFKVPETKGKTLEEIESQLKKTSLKRPRKLQAVKP